MNLTSELEVINTRAKLAELEARYDKLRENVSEDAHVREVTMKSLKRFINQLKEEIARYEAQQPARG